MTDTTNDQRIAVAQRMIKAWNDKDWQLAGDLFAEAGVLHSMMIEPVVGREAITSRIKALGEATEWINLNVRAMGVIGTAVFVERVDEFIYNGKRGAVPVVGVLEIEGETVTLWKEYYDRAQLLSEMGVTAETAPH